MSLTIVRGATDKPASSSSLIDILSKDHGLNGKLFVSFPIIKTGQGPRAIDAIFVSPDRGIVIFDLIEGRSPGNFSKRQDDAANALDSRLRLHRELLHRRNLKIKISTLSFAPARSSDISNEDGYAVKTRNSLTQALLSLKCPEYPSETYRLALSVLENIAPIKVRRPSRTVSVHDSRGSKLKRLENSIATLNANQSAAIAETVDGVQRIRGVSGSGKTTVLALKAAYLHALHPNWKIAVTLSRYETEGLFRDLIRKIMFEQTGNEADWDKLRFLNAWGNQVPLRSNMSGIYAQYCDAFGAEYMDYSQARKRFGAVNPFEQVCRHALLSTTSRAIDPLYDTILIDDAQDLSLYFLRICYRLLDSSKRLTYVHGELQSLTKQALPSPEWVFKEVRPETGTVAHQDMSIFPLKSDITLSTCYRSSRPILATAHSIRFGIYRDIDINLGTNLVQMFDRPRHWEDIGYDVKSGVLDEGENVRMWRSEASSPRFLENHSSYADIIQFLRFQNMEEQADWLVESISKNLNEDELGPSDILVINPNPLTARSRLGPICARLFDMKIASRFAGINAYRGEFYRNDDSSVTFSGINSVKGYEAGMVYIVNAHDGLSDGHSLATVRDRLCTAITRSRAWVRVLGVGSAMQQLIQEFSQLKRANFELDFRYPTLNERNRFRIAHKDRSEPEAERVQRRKALIDEVISEYNAGTLDIESRRKLESAVRGAA